MFNVLPKIIRNIAGRSYFHMNFSPKRQIAKIVLVTIAVAELHASNTRSANGSTTEEYEKVKTLWNKTYKSG